MNANGSLEWLDRIFLVVTNHCNARCKLCRYWKSNPREFLSLSVIRQEVIPLVSGYNTGLTLVTGGEPTLHPQLPEILRALKETGTQVSLITNGGCLDRIFADIEDYVDAYMFSIDSSHGALHHEIRGLDNFNEIIAWPRKILDRCPSARVAFACLIQEKNIHDLVDFYVKAADLPLDGIFFNVPELKPYCFGRRARGRPESRENALLDEKGIRLL